MEPFCFSRHVERHPPGQVWYGCGLCIWACAWMGHLPVATFFFFLSTPFSSFHTRSRWGYVRVESAWRWLRPCVLPGVDAFPSGPEALSIFLSLERFGGSGLVWFIRCTRCLIPSSVAHISGRFCLWTLFGAYRVAWPQESEARLLHATSFRNSGLLNLSESLCM